MRRRLIGNICTGLGNPEPEIFDNEWTGKEKFDEVVKSFFSDALDKIKDFSEMGGFDFKIELNDNTFKILFGLEPSYQFDPYICYCFDGEKEKSYIHKGQAMGYYGSDIRIKSNKSYQRCGKEFRECINRYYDNLMECLNG